MASIVTLSGSHVFPGATVAVSGPESELAVTTMVAGRWGTPPSPRCAIQTGCAHRCRVGAVLIGSKPLSTLKARPPELKHSLKALTKDASVL